MHVLTCPHSLTPAVIGACMRNRCSVLPDIFSNVVIMVIANVFEDEYMLDRAINTL